MSNLLDILAACAGGDPRCLAEGFDRYGELKTAVADAVLAALAPLRERRAELARRPEYVRTVLREGALRARELGEAKLRQVKEAIGLLEF